MNHKGIALVLLGAGLLQAPAFANDGDRVIEFTNADVDVRKNTPVNANRQIVIYKSLSEEGDGLSFSDQKPLSGYFEQLHYDCYACNPASTIDWRSITLNTAAFAQHINAMAEKYAIDAALVRAVMHAESAFNPKALSPKGAQGLMQLMPGTAKELGVKNAFDTTQNIEGGVKYLAGLLTTFNGDIQLATAAYNAGPGAVRRYNGIPPFAETQVYVERVGILHQRYREAS